MSKMMPRQSQLKQIFEIVWFYNVFCPPGPLQGGPGYAPAHFGISGLVSVLVPSWGPPMPAQKWHVLNKTAQGSDYFLSKGHFGKVWDLRFGVPWFGVWGPLVGVPRFGVHGLRVPWFGVLGLGSLFGTIPGSPPTPSQAAPDYAPACPNL